MELRSTVGILKLDKILSSKLVNFIIFSLVVALVWPTNIAIARSVSVGANSAMNASVFSKEVSNPAFTGISEFFYRNDRDDVLVPVFVLGAVAKPGLYHVPMKSDLLTLLAVSGGTTPEANLEEITIKNQQTNDIHELDLVDIVSSKRNSDLTLKGNEVVFIKPKEPAISNNTAVLVSVVAGLMSIILTGIIIRRETR